MEKSEKSKGWKKIDFSGFSEPINLSSNKLIKKENNIKDDSASLFPNKLIVNSETNKDNQFTDSDEENENKDVVEYQIDDEDLLDKDFELEESFYGVVDDSIKPFLTEDGEGSKSFSNNQDQARWENQLLSRGGIVKPKKLNLDELNVTNDVTKLIVKNTRPLFLNETSDVIIDLSGLKETVSVIKDLTSDMAKFSIQGSSTLNERRKEKSKTKFRHRFWELGGSKMGNALKMTNEEDKKSEKTLENDYKNRVGYSNHFKYEKQTKEFRKKIEKDRKNLPIYSVREDLLRLIRNQQVIIIVGETGSGRATSNKHSRWRTRCSHSPPRVANPLPFIKDAGVVEK